MTMITEPGFFPDMPADEYHSDPCPKPSLNQSLAKVLLDRSPLHAWYQHPRLNPNYERNGETKFDLGTCAHAMLIGRGKEIVPIPFDDWRSKAAKEAREDAALSGKQAVLQSQYERAAEMVAAALLQLDARGLSNLFNSKHGAGELVMCWEESGTWLRQMIDWLSAADPSCNGSSWAGCTVARHGGAAALFVCAARGSAAARIASLRDVRSHVDDGPEDARRRG